MELVHDRMPLILERGEAVDWLLEDGAAETGGGEVYFAILPTRKEIPDNLQITVSDVVSALKQ